MELEKEIEIIKERNKRVEIDKAWEVSWTRRVFIMVMTYIIASLWLFMINESLVLLKAVVPVLGYILSTLSLPLVREKWARNKMN